jgi:hypothetical protein
MFFVTSSGVAAIQQKTVKAGKRHNFHAVLPIDM